MPRFDSSFIFGSLLDTEKGGEFSISTAATPLSTKQYYQENTNILCTEFHTESGDFRVTDFAPRFYHFERYFKPLMLVRKLEPISGEPAVSVACFPRGEWGTIEPQLSRGATTSAFLTWQPRSG